MVEQNKNDDEDELIIDLEEEEEKEEDVKSTPSKEEEKPEPPEEEDDDENLPDEPDATELESYSKRVRKRMDKLTAQKHAERREKENLRQQLEEATRFTKKVLGENSYFKRALNTTEVTFKDTRKASLEDAIVQTRAAHKAAYESGDGEAITATAEQMAKLYAELQQVNSWQPRQYQETEPAPERQEQPRIDPKVTDWQSRNGWFGVDTAMTGYAVGLHTELVNRGLDPRTDEYFASVDKEMRKRFPDRFNIKPEERRPDKTVAPAGRTTGKQGKRIRLSPTQVALAKRLGLTTEEYAKEALKLEQEDG